MKILRLLIVVPFLFACGGNDKKDPPPDDQPIPCTNDTACDDQDSCTEDLCIKGFCENNVRQNGYPCDDDDLCTEADACRDGECDGAPVDCSSLSDLCNDGTCDAATGGCVLTPVPNGTTCNDGLDCTSNDTCTDGECDGPATDCSALDSDCSEGVCIEDQGGCVASPINENGNCSDGGYCVVNGKCVAGKCEGTPRDCEETVPDPCTIDTCDNDLGQCVHEPIGLIPGAEGPPGDPTCSDNEDNDCDGVKDALDVSCQSCSTAGQCDDGNPCTTDTCPVNYCVNTPINCADIDPCTSDFCDPVQGCRNEALVFDNDSPVGTSGGSDTPCLTAGSDARLVAWADLRDLRGLPVSGVDVTIGGVTATEAATLDGVYYREITAPASPSTLDLPVSIDDCSQNVTLTDHIVIDVVAANTKTNGTGGCSPLSGNLRIRVLDDETRSPISGASVLLGQAEANSLEHSPEALFGGSSSLTSNVATTDASGWVEFYDYGTELAGPVTVTAGAPNRVYFTIVGGDAADVAVALPLLSPTPPQTTLYELGTSSATFSDCSELDVGLVLPKLNMESLSSFNFATLLGKSQCWESDNLLVGTVALPENIWIPDQGLGPLCILGGVDPAPWNLTLANTADTGETENIQMATARADINDLIDILMAGGSVVELLSVLSYQGIGFTLDETVPTVPTSGHSIDDFDTYNANLTVTYGGIPEEADVVGVAAADYTGSNGTGPLFLVSTKLHPYTEPGSTVVLPISDLNATGMPSNTRGVGFVVGLYVNPGEHTDIASNRREATTTVLLRQNPTGGPPFDGTANATATVSDFLDLVGADWDYIEPNRFEWDNVTANLNQPLYSRHELMIKQNQFLPLQKDSSNQDCQWGDNEERQAYSLQWIVLKPFRPDCAGRECFDLPTLPGSFPRADTADRKRSGFEQRVGRGYEKYCTSDPSVCNDIPGETCGDPDEDGLSKMCLGGSGTDADPFYYEHYWWRVHVYDLELAPSFEFQDFDFDDRRRYLTHETTNGVRFW